MRRAERDAALRPPRGGTVVSLTIIGVLLSWVVARLITLRGCRPRFSLVRPSEPALGGGRSVVASPAPRFAAGRCVFSVTALMLALAGPARAQFFFDGCSLLNGHTGGL